MKNSPDYFLQLIQKSKKGRLKVYIGMIAGVGKSYRMLQEAHDLLKAGVDIRIGFIETHGREETEALIEGIPLIPLREVFYKGKVLREMDLEAILRLKPSIVIVDELAHTNIPGSLHAKRWEDVEVLIDAGIHVITAFNVQHLESLNDKVKQLSGIEVTERIPDTFLRKADEVVSIDLPADDLIKRLKEGKIYKEEKIQQALSNFFQAKKILQLRELALLQVAKNLESKINFIQQQQSSIIERFMACVSTEEVLAKKVIRKTARLANNYHAEWFVVYVKTPKESTEKINVRTETKLLQNLKLASTLGANVYIYESNSKGANPIQEIHYQTIHQGTRVISSEHKTIADVLFEAAKNHQATNIVIGKPKQSIWRNISGQNHFHNLVQLISPTDIDLIVVT
ncbi:Osmosensitive K+ channel histidine kinase KdpD [Lunatimonas lonarensis]|uniref:Osmosensitive K+ channel histidine kinase KdpD n=1 Tax=Lunatimonas lonarensis TaxID=1232681 RepID=R7ZVS6_9BACT|nr:universal stress protein [Lunatimonas lonarensis]EON78089.1 Osmosensitive K+ channel histidine kinase KdpD [Lunatimonas lonarensis]